MSAATGTGVSAFQVIVSGQRPVIDSWTGRLVSKKWKDSGTLSQSVVALTACFP